MPNRAFRTLAHALVDNAAHRGDQVAYEYLHDDGRVDAITYRDLLARATATAVRLRPAGSPPGPALLLYPPGLDFVVALWACLLAGVPAVPAYPPLLGSTERIAARFTRVLDDSRATVLLADPVVLGLLTANAPGLALPDVVTLDAGDHGSSPPPALPGEDDVALIQYTSGSTGAPKGVVLRHRNLLANIESIAAVFELDESARVVSWLPPYHDMGLIGFILTPVHGAFPVRLMSPVHFLKNPLAWLRQIGELGITHSGGPNFAYDLCLRRAATADLSGLDLSTWRVAFNGAEPIRRRTITAFAERFAPHGFRAEAFLPCYGLAEATLIVTGRHWSDRDGLDGDGRVDCGPVIAGHDLVIVDPGTGEPVGEGVEGEVWVSGPSVSDGYWNDTADGESFGVLGGVRRLRTGDLGTLRGGHLVVTGRCKDVLIQHGVNHHAHDLESAAVTENPLVRPTAAAFGGTDDEVVIAVEPAGDHPPEHVAEDVRARVLAETGVRVAAVALCPPRTLPRTTSGKVQRSLARERYLTGALTGRVVTAGPAVAGPQADLIAGFLSSVFAAVCEVPACSPTDTLSALGGDSVRAAEIAGVVEDALTLPVPVDLVLVAQSPRELTARLAALWAGAGVPPTEATARVRTAMAGGPE